MFKPISLFPIIFSLFLFVSCKNTLPEEVKTVWNQLPDKIDYNFHVKPILSDRCFACHGNDKANQKAGLRLDLDSTATAELPNKPGHFAIVPKSIAQSELIKRILSDVPSHIMPPPESNLKLSDYEKALLIKWIEQGAEYLPHWSFLPPQKPTIPQIEKEKWPKYPIEH